MHWTRQLLLILMVSAISGYLSARFVTPMFIPTQEMHPDYGLTAKERAKAQALVFDDTPTLTPCEQLAMIEAWDLFQRGGLSERQMLELSALISRSACEREKRELAGN